MSGQKANTGQELTTTESADREGIAYDPHLLERSRTQWQFGDWESLAKLEIETIRSNPEKEKLALMAAAANLQIGNFSEARTCLHMAREWGCGRQLISRILIAGVHNSLGRAAAVADRREKALRHFEQSLTTGIPGADTWLLTQARIKHQLSLMETNRHPFVTLLPKASVRHRLTSLSTLKAVPRFVIINGMARSGSTVAMNIVTDLIGQAGAPCAKYYIEDFSAVAKIGDHIRQNPGISVVLKTHVVGSQLRGIADTYGGRFVYTKRNLLEVSASYLRMTRNPASPFYRKNPVDFGDLIKFLDLQVCEYRNAKALPRCLVIDCDELQEMSVEATVEKISDFLEIDADHEMLSRISKERTQRLAASYSASLDRNELTSLGHDRATFFHVDHVVVGGTEVSEFLPGSWRDAIIVHFKDCIDSDGNLW